MSEEGKGWHHLGTGLGFLRAHLQRDLPGLSMRRWVGERLLNKEEE